MADKSWGGPCKGTIQTVVLSNGVKLPVRKEIAELIALLCAETMRRGYDLVPGWCWGYACRKISGSSRWSNHAWGLAVDLNAPKNPYGKRLVTDMPSWMPELWKSYGFRWGGDYRSVKDAMHYEFMGSVADAKRQTERARAELGKGEPGKPEPELNTARITKIELRKQYEEASARWPFFHDVERQYGLPSHLLFAVGSRETNLRSKYTEGATGDGGHGHGVFQLDDRWHEIPPGFDTNIHAQARKAAEMLRDGIERHGLLGGLNYYNSGRTATSATTGKDYGPDVIARMEFLQATFDLATRLDEEDEVIPLIRTKSGKEGLYGLVIKDGWPAKIGFSDGADVDELAKLGKVSKKHHTVSDRFFNKLPTVGVM